LLNIHRLFDVHRHGTPPSIAHTRRRMGVK
jgi:hypothetical protein